MLPKAVVDSFTLEVETTYIRLQELQNYQQMNRDGFRKILKKHDKVTQSPLMQECMPEVEERLPACHVEEVQRVRRRLSQASRLPPLIVASALYSRL